MAVWFPGEKKKKGKAKVCLESEEKKSKNPSMTEKALRLWKQELQENVSLYFFSLLSLKYI